MINDLVTLHFSQIHFSTLLRARLGTTKNPRGLRDSHVPRFSFVRSPQIGDSVGDDFGCISAHLYISMSDLSLVCKFSMLRIPWILWRGGSNLKTSYFTCLTSRIFLCCRTWIFQMCKVIGPKSRRIWLPNVPPLKQEPQI